MLRYAGEKIEDENYCADEGYIYAYSRPSRRISLPNKSLDAFSWAALRSRENVECAGSWTPFGLHVAIWRTCTFFFAVGGIGCVAQYLWKRRLLCLKLSFH